MANKSKSKSTGLSELHFISSLQLEQAVGVIGNIADTKHQVTLTQVSPDEFHFQIDYLPNRSKEAEIKGKLQRWNGTATRVDADGRVSRVDAPSILQRQIKNLVTSASVTFVGGGIAILAGQAWLAVPIFFGSLMGVGYFNVSADENEQRKVFFRYRDYLLQHLINAFKPVGNVEAL